MPVFTNPFKSMLTRHYAPHQPGTPILAVFGLTVRYNGHAALDDVTFDLRPIGGIQRR
jgi:hypothetical protein